MKFNILIIIVSLAGVFLIIWRKIPALANVSEENARSIQPYPLSRVFSLLKHFPGDRLIHFLLQFLEKILRKLKVIFLKIDNVIAGWLRSVKRRISVPPSANWRSGWGGKSDESKKPMTSEHEHEDKNGLPT